MSRDVVWSLTAGALLICAGCGGSRATVDTGAAVESQLPGFAALSTPRSWLPLGAIWNEGVGPAGSGVDSGSVRVVRSLDERTAVAVGMGVSEAKAGILRLIGVNASEARAWKDSVRLEELEIVSVGDFSDLPLTSGTNYVWEAVRVLSFTASGFRFDSTYARAALDSSGIGQNVTFGVSENQGKRMSVHVRGSKLYVALRVVGFEDSLPRVSRIVVDRPSRRVSIGSDYEVRFEPRGPDAAVGKECRASLIVRFGRKWQGARPLEKSWPVACGAVESGEGFWSSANARGADDMRVELDAYETSGEFRLDELVLNGTYFLGGPNWVEGAGTFALERRVLKKKVVPGPRARGWIE